MKQLDVVRQDPVDEGDQTADEEPQRYPFVVEARVNGEDPLRETPLDCLHIEVLPVPTKPELVALRVKQDLAVPVDDLARHNPLRVRTDQDAEHHGAQVDSGRDL